MCLWDYAIISESLISTVAHRRQRAKMAIVRGYYDEEFKRKAVKMSYDSSMSISAVARELGIHPSMLHRWRDHFTPEGRKPDDPMTEKCKVLERRVLELEVEQDMLKKAVAYFANLQK